VITEKHPGSSPLACKDRKDRIYTTQKIKARFKFLICISKTNVEVTRSNMLIPTERRRNTHEKYQSPSTLQSYYIAKVKVFNKVGYPPRSRSQSQTFCSHGKVLPQGILMLNVKALVITI
jgi:hypothetical protein